MSWEDPNDDYPPDDPADHYWDQLAAYEDTKHDMWLETWEFCTPSCEWCWKACHSRFPNDPYCTAEIHSGVMCYARQGHGCEYFGPIIGPSILKSKTEIKDCFGCEVQLPCHGATLPYGEV